jgi:hypothetical protein
MRSRDVLPALRAYYNITAAERDEVGIIPGRLQNEVCSSSYSSTDPHRLGDKNDG